MIATMTAKEASDQYFGGTISYWKLLKMAKTGIIPHIRVGSRFLFRKETLDEWLSTQENASVSVNEQRYQQITRSITSSSRGE